MTLIENMTQSDLNSGLRLYLVKRVKNKILFQIKSLLKRLDNQLS